MRSTRCLTPLLSLLSLTLLGCGLPIPTETEARADYRAQKTHLDNMDTALRKAIAEIPHFGVPVDALPCTPPPPQKTPTSGLEKLVDGLNCDLQRLKLIEARGDAILEFQAKTLPALVKQHSLIGADVTCKLAGAPTTQAVGEAGPVPPLYKNGTVRAEQGITIGARRIGWGIYHDPAADNADRRGLEVFWHFQQQQAKIKALVFLWMD